MLFTSPLCLAWFFQHKSCWTKLLSWYSYLSRFRWQEGGLSHRGYKTTFNQSVTRSPSIKGCIDTWSRRLWFADKKACLRSGHNNNICQLGSTIDQNSYVFISYDPNIVFLWLTDWVGLKSSHMADINNCRRPQTAIYLRPRASQTVFYLCPIQTKLPLFFSHQQCKHF